MNDLVLGKRTHFKDKNLKDFSYEVTYDDKPRSPRDFTVSRMICLPMSRRIYNFVDINYNFGDDHYYNTFYDMFHRLAIKYSGKTEEEINCIEGKGETNEKIYNLWSLLLKIEDIVIMALYMTMENGGEQISHKKLLGVIYQTKMATISSGADESSWREKAIENIRRDVVLYKAYINHDVYHYILYFDPTGEIITTSNTYYGKESLDDLIHDVTSEAEYYKNEDNIAMTTETGIILYYGTNYDI